MQKLKLESKINSYQDRKGSHKSTFLSLCYTLLPANSNNNHQDKVPTKQGKNQFKTLHRNLKIQLTNNNKN